MEETKTMQRRHLLAAPALLALAPAARAQTAAWPERQVTITIPFGPGVSQDVLARLIAPHLQAAWGRPVVVNNVPGAAGTIGVDRVVRSPRDGYNMVLSGDAAIVVRVSMSPRPPYDPLRDLAPIMLIGRTPNVLVVAANSPIRSFQDLLAAARAQPGQISFGHAGPGTSQHIGGEMLAQMANLQLNGVAYNDPAQQILDVATGRVTMSFQSGVVALPRLRDGTYRGLAVSSAARMSTLPDMPTVAELGLPGFDATAWLGLFAPAGTPEPVINRINADVSAALNQAEVRARLVDLGVELVASTPAQLGALMRAEIPRMAGVLQRAGIRPE
jgi:tripartite-type tricarboxylate transporter receptor subunit TctC